MGLPRDFSGIVHRAAMLSSSNRGTSRSTAAARPRRSARQHPLGLERLEGRVAPAVFVVTNSADSGAGSLRQAILQSNGTTGPNEIDVASGLGPIVLTSGELLIKNSVQIMGADTTVSGNHSSRVFEIAAAAGPVMISSISVKDGDNLPGAYAGGGGILNRGDLTLISCTITGNTTGEKGYGGGIYNGPGASLRLVGGTIANNYSAFDGGGISNYGGSLNADKVTIVGNRASLGAGLGGGLANEGGGSARLSGTNFIGNSAVWGGAIFNDFSYGKTLDIEGGSISSNTCAGMGGAIWNRGILTITDAQVIGNTAPGDGGGIWNGPTGTLNVSSDGLNSITSNVAGTDGGGIENQGILNVTGYTINHNVASSFGGGIDNNGGTLVLDTSTVTGDYAMTGGGILIRSGGTLVRRGNNLVSGNIGGDIVSTDRASTAAFGKPDATTQGAWIGTYGATGYDVIGGPSRLPSYAAVTPSGQATTIWAAPTTDPRALQVPGTASRVAACWSSGSGFKVDVDLIDGAQHNLELYFLDWDTTSRAETVQISDAATGSVLSTQPIASFHNGLYLDYRVSGHVVITITKTGGANAVLSGLFLDPSS